MTEMIRAKTRAPGLHVGDVFRHHEGEPGEWEVVRISPSAAAVRPLARRHVVIEGLAEFDAPGRVVYISRHASVVLVS